MSEPNAMILLPAIDLRHGRVVQLVGGDPTQVAVERPNPDGQARAFADAGATWIHVVDLDAAFGERNQWSRLPGILGARGVRVQFGGGIRSMTQVQQLIELGVERIVVGTQGVLNPAWVRELCLIFPGRIVLAVDARGRDVVVKGWTEATGQDVVQLVTNLDDAGLAGFLYTNVEKEGRLAGMDRDAVSLVRAAAKRTKLFVSGGITTTEDLRWLQQLGVDGAILGMSIYKGELDLELVIQEFPQPRHRLPLQLLTAREDTEEEAEPETADDMDGAEA